MKHVGFILPAITSLVFAVWFAIVETESPGMSFGVALLVMPMLLAIFGFTKVVKGEFTSEVQIAGWVAVGTAFFGVLYMLLFFLSWLIISFVWLVSHIPLAISILPNQFQKK